MATGFVLTFIRNGVAVPLLQRETVRQLNLEAKKLRSDPKYRGGVFDVRTVEGFKEVNIRKCKLDKICGMDILKVDRTKLITQSEYGRLTGNSRQMVHHLVKNGKVKTVDIKGTTLILME
jgi:hypothetical protein